MSGDEEERNHGGARLGAGRKGLGGDTVDVSVRLGPEHARTLRQVREALGQAGAPASPGAAVRALLDAEARAPRVRAR